MKKVITHKVRDNIASFLYVLLMMFLFAMIGLLMGGFMGLFMAAFFILLFSVVTPRVSPQLVFRRYRGRPLSLQEAPELYRITAEVAGNAGIDHVPRLFYLPITSLNAFTVGNRNEAAIGITDGLLRSLTPREIRGVMAHEMSHVRHNDLWIMNLAENLTWFTRLFSLFGQWLLLFSLPFILIGGAVINIATALGVGLLISAPYFSFRLKQALSRSREFKADAGAAEIAGDSFGLASALQKIEFRTSGLMDFFFVMPGKQRAAPEMQSHPDTEERIRRLLALEKEKKRGVIKKERKSGFSHNRRRSLP